MHTHTHTLTVCSFPVAIAQSHVFCFSILSRNLSRFVCHKCCKLNVSIIVFDNLSLKSTPWNNNHTSINRKRLTRFRLWFILNALDWQLALPFDLWPICMSLKTETESRFAIYIYLCSWVHAYIYINLYIYLWDHSWKLEMSQLHSFQCHFDCWSRKSCCHYKCATKCVRNAGAHRYIQ